MNMDIVEAKRNIEKYETKELAQQRELQIKSWKSRIKIQELISKKD